MYSVKLSIQNCCNTNAPPVGADNVDIKDIKMRKNYIQGMAEAIFGAILNFASSFRIRSTHEVRFAQL